MFQHDGVPPSIVMDGSKEQTMGPFCAKAREANCWIKQTKPLSPSTTTMAKFKGENSLTMHEKSMYMDYCSVKVGMKGVNRMVMKTDLDGKS
jgi:hypothetical protein